MRVTPDDYEDRWNTSRQCVNDRAGAFSYTIDRPSAAAGGASFVGRSDELWMLASQSFFVGDCYREQSIQTWKIRIVAQVVQPSGALGPEIVMWDPSKGLGYSVRLVYKDGRLTLFENIDIELFPPIP